MTVANIFVFSLGFCVACLLGLIACRMVWVRAVRLTRSRFERDRPETLRAFEARIAGAQARAAISIRELERALERERQISAQARLMADQMTSSSALALAERDDTQASLVNLSDTLNATRDRMRENEETLQRRNGELSDLRRDLTDARQDLALREDDIARLNDEIGDLRRELAAQMAGDGDPDIVTKLAETGDASAMARAQIDTLRETVRQLRAEKNSAEASAARARLLLNAQDDDEASTRQFDEERAALLSRIEELEDDVRKARHPAPHLVSVSEPSSSVSEPPAAQGEALDTELEALRQSIDTMAATLTAEAARDDNAGTRINTLLDEAQDEESESALVTSLVQARNRLRAKETASKEPTAKTKKPAPRKRSSATSRATKGKTALAKAEPATKKTPSKAPAIAAEGGTAPLVAATASGASDKPQGKRRALPRASESDLNVI